MISTHATPVCTEKPGGVANDSGLGANCAACVVSSAFAFCGLQKGHADIVGSSTRPHDAHVRWLGSVPAAAPAGGAIGVGGVLAPGLEAVSAAGGGPAGAAAPLPPLMRPTIWRTMPSPPTPPMTPAPMPT